MTGIGPEAVEVESELLRTQVSVDGISSGTLTLLARPSGSSTFESIVDGTIDLTASKTLLIEGFSIDALSVTTTESTPYTLLLTQTELKLF